MTRTVIIGARGSTLSRIQALQVGDALQARHAGFEPRYVFSAAPADLPYSGALLQGDQDAFETNVGAINRRGGFASHLHELLDAGAVDLAVHSWKDLPLPERVTTVVAATLPRADVRDVVLFSRVALQRLAAGSAPQGVLRILSCSARRRVNLAPFLRWSLPVPPNRVEFLPVRGDIERRLEALLRGDADGLVVAKAALDRLLAAPSPRFDGAREKVRAALAQCRLQIVPLAINPAAPGQGALAIELRRDRTDLIELLSPVNDALAYRLVQSERAALAALGDDETPVGISAIDVGFGAAEFMRGEYAGAPLDRVTLARRSGALPRPRTPADVWCGDAIGADPFRRVPLELPSAAPGPRTGLLVARADALPRGWALHDSQCVWTAGLTTWRRLAARGIWVNGTDESLGETAAVGARHLFPDIHRWVKLSHESGFETSRAEWLPTYRLLRVRETLKVGAQTHFFWTSGSQFLEYLRATPGLARAWHGSGPGNTLRVIRDTIGDQRVRPFLSAAQFREEMQA